MNLLKPETGTIQPSVLGLKRSFGFGDRLGLATPGHLAASRAFGFAPIFAQQSIREMTRTQRTPEDVMSAAVRTLSRASYEGEWGADADHLKTPDDVRRTAKAGFTFFTIDPSDHLDQGADEVPESMLPVHLDHLLSAEAYPADWAEAYAGKTFEPGDGVTLAFSSEKLKRAAIKYGRALKHCETMAKAIAEAMNGRPYEIEVSVDETHRVTTPLEHFFVASELKRRGVSLASLAPRFVGDFEKGIDYRGDVEEFEQHLKAHVAIARACGPYKISIHSGSDKFSVYPVIGRICGDLLHVKTAGTSYLEALRVAARQDASLFGAICAFAHERFETDRASYHISTTNEEVAALAKVPAAEREQAYLDERAGRQLLHVTFGSVLTVGKTAAGRAFKEALTELLVKEADLHRDLLEGHFMRHLGLLEGRDVETKR